MSNIKSILVGVLFILLGMCSILEVPEEISDPTDPNYNLIAPTLLSASPLTDVQIELKWRNNEEYTREFQILRATDSSDYKVIVMTSGDVLRYVDSNCVLGTNYTYSIKTQVESNQSRGSNAITVATLFPAPSGLSASSVSDIDLRLTWIDSLGYVEGFRIERDSGEGYFELALISANVTEYIDRGLTYGQSYNYRVAAYTLINSSSWTSITATTVFNAPTDLSVTAISDSEVNLDWTDNTSFELGFKIERDDGIGYSEVGTVSENITEYEDGGLTLGQIYTYRVSAYTNSSFSEYCAPVNELAVAPLIDYDGNTYEVIKIGDQIWMAENLMVTHYRDGTPILNLTSNDEWINANSGAYCFYDNGNPDELPGALYNWYAMIDTRNIAPDGWHAPTDYEWMEMEMFLGMSQSEAYEYGFRGANEGSKIAGNNILWPVGQLLTGGGFGSTGFDALPSGERGYHDGGFYAITGICSFWTTAQYQDKSPNRSLSYSNSSIIRDNRYRGSGLSIRLIRDYVSLSAIP
jgi:uncharacterized protein (TIGR02145 family)